MQQYEIPAYNEKTGKGVVRHIMGRVGVNTGEVMAVIITAGYDLPHGKELVKMLRDAVPGLKSVVQNINKKQTNIVMGNKTRLLYGKATIKDRLGTLKFNISAQSFFQVNSVQAEKLYNKAVEFAALSGAETVVDCYCGTGTISLYLAKHAQKVYGIEIIAPAIEDARRNAEDNRCDNAEFILGDAAVKMQELAEQGVRPEVVLLDPPRAGCEEKVLAAIAQVKPQRIVYVSCNPASLARDLVYLEQNGYELIEYNYRCRDGEIDIIAKDGDCYVFCEVKYRSGRQAGNPLEAVDQRKQKKIFRCALYYTVQHGIEDAQCRFDVIGVEGTEITHIKNAFVG